MKVDTGVMAPSLSDIGPRARELEELGYDGLLTAETGHDAFLPIALGGRAHRAHRARDRHRGRVRPHPDGAGVHGQRPAADVEGPVRPRPRLADQAAHREAVLDAVVAPGPAHARVHPRVAGDLERVERPDAAEVRGRVLPPHVDDAVLRADPQPVRRAQGVPRRGRGEDDRGRGRGRRRHHHPRLHHRALRQGSDDARHRTRPAASGRERSSFQVSGPLFVVTGRDRGGDRAAATRASSSRSRSTAPPPRTAACSSCTAGATCRPS